MKAQKLYNLAHEAGLAAADKTTPDVMVVVAGDQVHHIAQGVCGYAWVLIRPARGWFVNWLKKKGIGYKQSAGGWRIPIMEFGQSMELKQAYAGAFAGVLAGAGMDAYGNSQID